ncbi:unnamed protein product, partial [Nesidiocoris tenuis]
MANAPAEEDFDGMERENSMIRPTDENCDFQTVKEGRAEVIFNSGQSVFYNPVQEFNRDLSMAMYMSKHQQKSFDVVDLDPYGCPSRFLDATVQVGGPVWSGPLHDVPFVEKLLSHVEKNFDKFGTAKRMIGMLSLIKDELTTPFYYTVDAVCSLVHCEAIPLIKFRSALANAGFKVSETHVAKNSVKTNAPVQVIWDMIRTWVLQGHPVSQKRLDDCPTVRRILETPCTTKINFEFNPEAVSEANSEKLVRFQVNPAPNWGPGMRNKNKIASGQLVGASFRKMKTTRVKFLSLGRTKIIRE